jgi:hypothetical protein
MENKPKRARTPAHRAAQVIADAKRPPPLSIRFNQAQLDKIQALDPNSTITLIAKGIVLKHIGE